MCLFHQLAMPDCAMPFVSGGFPEISEGKHAYRAGSPAFAHCPLGTFDQFAEANRLSTTYLA
jgi:hypothetical protein